MWTARANSGGRQPEVEAELGRVTIGGIPAAVETRGEVRELPVFGPGGYTWVPKRGDRVLVIKGGPGGEEQCVVAAEPEGEVQYPGEILIQTGTASLRMYIDGRIELVGDLYINGVAFGEL